MRRPNIVFIMADQLAAGFVGCYGSGVNSTPMIDYLAREGTKLDRSYAVCPVCAPNRASIFTGRSPCIHGITTNNLTLSTDIPTLAQVLGQNDYKTGIFGKFHQTPMQMPLPKDFKYLGFNEAVSTEDTKLGPWLDWIEKEFPEYYDRALATCWPMPYLKEYGDNKKNIYPDWDNAYHKYLSPIQKASKWHMMYSSLLPKELHQTTYITDVSLDFMERHLESTPETPFFCHVSYVDPHDPYDPPKPYDTMFEPNDMLAPTLNSWKARGNKVLDGLREWHNCYELEEMPDAVLELRALYHGSIKFIDDQIGRIVDFLKDNNLWDDTILVFTSDHGDMMFDQGLMTKGRMHYDKSIRCPLIFSGGGIKEGLVTDRLTSSLDLFPTFCDLAGIVDRPGLEGKSFAGLISEKIPLEYEVKMKNDVLEKSSAFYEWFGKDSKVLNHQSKPEWIIEKHSTNEHWDVVNVEFNNVRTIVTDDYWRLTIYAEGQYGEMFDLKNDPTEQNNLYYEEQYKTKKEELLVEMVCSYMKPLSIHQYRNLPVQSGHKCGLLQAFDLTGEFTIKEKTPIV